ncbi:MAG: BMP family ABC transporter substrate-binding protein [Clostridiales bacterium]|nr:BMP family ABC transporter substrate-binding protein [Clostridiales bacterium]
MKKKVTSVLLTSVMLCSLAVSGTSVLADEAADVSVCLVYSGMLGDQSFNDMCHNGMLLAEEDFDIEVKELEGSTSDEWQANLLSACEDGYDLVICTSSNLSEFLSEYHDSYPDTKFAIIDDTVEGDNIVSVSFAQNQGSFLAGAAAALFTQHDEIEGVNSDHIIGWVGGMDIPVLHDFYVGYYEGAKYVDPDVQILQSFVGNWTDPATGKSMTEAQYDLGADIVMNVASGTGAGILQAAADNGKFAIGVDDDQDSQYPGSILTSQLKRVDNAVYSVIQSVVEGTFEAGSSYMTLADGGVSLTDFSVMKEALGDDFPDEIVETVEELEEKIISGEIVVSNYEGYGPEDAVYADYGADN